MFSNFDESLRTQYSQGYLIRLIGAYEDKNNFILNMGIMDEIDSDFFVERFEVKCSDYVKSSHNLDFYDYDDLTIYDDHLFLWDINRDRYDLYYTSKPDDMTSFIGDLCLAHNKITECRIPFSRYIHNEGKEYSYDYSISAEYITTRPYGIFASGPEPIITEYHNILSKYSMKPSMIHNLYYQNLGKENKFKVLVFGNSYIIAKHFSVTKRAGQNFA